jgi:hypothetical protein
LTTPSGWAAAAFRCSSVLTSKKDSPASVAAFFAASMSFSTNMVDASEDDEGGEFRGGLTAIFQLRHWKNPLKMRKAPVGACRTMRAMKGGQRHGAARGDTGAVRRCSWRIAPSLTVAGKCGFVKQTLDIEAFYSNKQVRHQRACLAINAPIWSGPASGADQEAYSEFSLFWRS